MNFDGPDSDTLNWNELTTLFATTNKIFYYKHSESAFLLDFAGFLGKTDVQYWKNLFDPDLSNGPTPVKMKKNNRQLSLDLTPRESHFSTPRFGSWDSFIFNLYVQKSLDYKFVAEKGFTMAQSLYKHMAEVTRRQNNEIMKSPKCSLFLINYMKLLFLAKYDGVNREDFIEHFENVPGIRDALSWTKMMAPEMGLNQTWRILFTSIKIQLPNPFCDVFPGAIPGSIDIALLECKKNFEESLEEPGEDMVKDERFAHIDAVRESRELLARRKKDLKIQRENTSKIFGMASLQMKRFKTDKALLTAHENSHKELLNSLDFLEKIEKLKPATMESGDFWDVTYREVNDFWKSTGRAGDMPRTVKGSEQKTPRTDIASTSQTKPCTSETELTTSSDAHTGGLRSEESSDDEYIPRADEQSEEDMELEELCAINADELPCIFGLYESDCDSVDVNCVEKVFAPRRKCLRKTEAVLIAERNSRIMTATKNCVQEGLLLGHFAGKGRGIICTKMFQKNEFVIEYAGELLDSKSAKDRDITFEITGNLNCYMFFFTYLNRGYCVDATKETDRLGRLINHSRQGNVKPIVVEVNNIPRLVMVAKRDIGVNEELTYDYGDRRRKVMLNNPWLKK